MLKHRFAAGSLLLVLASGAQAASLSVAVAGDVASPAVYNATSLQALPPTTETEAYNAAGSPVTDTFTGPTLNSLLSAAGGIGVNAAVKNDILSKYIVATGSDGYEAVFSAGEISAKFGNRADLVAISDTSNTLPSPNGVARIVAAGGVVGGRYVSNITSLFVGSSPIQPAMGGGATSSFVVQGGVATSATFGLSQLQALTPHTETVTYMSGATSVTDTYTGALVAPGDIAGGRYVSNLASPTVFDGSIPVPEPASFALLGIGALGLGLVVRRKRS